MIGSGATAATLIPAIARDAAHVTMLQRSPTYFRTGRNAIEIAETLRALQVDEAWIHEIIRRKILLDQDVFTRKHFAEPEAAKKDLLSAVEAYLGPDYDIATHFTPKYRPWRQRIAFIPDGDLFKGISPARHLSSPTRSSASRRSGILLKSGQVLDADIIVTATGFNLNANRRHRIFHRRQAARLRRYRHLSRHDVHGVPIWSGCSAISAPVGRCGSIWSPTLSAACSRI